MRTSTMPRFFPGLIWLAATAAVQISCSESLTPGSSTESEVPDKVILIAAVSPTSGTGIVGSTVSELPAVIAQDANGNPVANISVTFTPTEGKGTVTGGAPLTNSAGIASPTRWVLGTAPGLNVVTATAGNMRPINFTRTALVGPPATILKAGGDLSIGSTGVTLDYVAAMVADAFGNGVPGVTVSFSVKSGGGSISSSSEVTDASGRTKPKWTLGPASGTQTLGATVEDLAPVVFTAWAINRGPCLDLPMDIGELIIGRLDPSRCIDTDGRPMWATPLNLPADSYVFMAQSNQFNTELELRDLGLNLIADDDGSGTNSSFKLITAPGFYYLRLKPHLSGNGDFLLSMKQNVSGLGGCSDIFVTRGISTVQPVERSDCKRSETESERRFKIFVKAGDSVSIQVDDQNKSGVSGELTDLNGKRVVPGTSYNSMLTFTPTADGFYVIVVYGLNAKDNRFRLTVQ